MNVLSLFQYLIDEHGVNLSAADVHYYWQHVERYFPWGSSHPAQSEKKHWPISLYGDEARYTDSAGLVEKIAVVNLSFVLWRPASTRNSRFVVWALRESLCVQHKTLWSVYAYLKWCLEWLYLGLKPSAGYLGAALRRNLRRSTESNDPEPLCKREIQCALVELRADWAWHSFSCQLVPRWNSNKPCFKCTAAGHERLDFSLSASWISKQVSHTTFMETMLKGPQPCKLAAAQLVYLSFMLVQGMGWLIIVFMFL